MVRSVVKKENGISYCRMPKMRNMPLVAVVVPAFNVGRYLKECLNSLALQSYSNIVVNVVDDGSTDDTGQIADAFAARDERFVVMHQPNRGVGVARNTALAAIYAQQAVDYVAFVDGDDYVAPNFVQRLLETAQENQSDITVSCFRYFDENGVLDDGRRFAVPQCLSKEEFIRLVFSRRDWKGTKGSGGMVCKALFSKAVIDGVFFTDDVECVEDEPFSLEALIRAKTIFYLPEELYCYRRRSGSLTSFAEKIDRMLLASGKRCIPMARKVSPEGELIVAGHLLESAVCLYKRCQVGGSDLIQYRDLFVKARNAGEIGQKFCRQYLLFCDHPVLTKGYLALRRWFNIIIMRKKQTNKQWSDIFCTEELFRWNLQKTEAAFVMTLGGERSRSCGWFRYSDVV